MADVYSNAHVVIAADRVQDSTSGFLQERKYQVTATVDLPGGSGVLQAIMLDSYNQYFDEGPEFREQPLNGRG